MFRVDRVQTLGCFGQKVYNSCNCIQSMLMSYSFFSILLEGVLKKKFPQHLTKENCIENKGLFGLFIFWESAFIPCWCLFIDLSFDLRCDWLLMGVEFFLAGIRLSRKNYRRKRFCSWSDRGLGSSLKKFNANCCMLNVFELLIP